MLKLRSMVLGLMLTVLTPTADAEGIDGKDRSTISVQAKEGSPFVRISIKHHRELGKIHLVVKDREGRTLYSEQGRAYTSELVRNLDRNDLTSGPLELTVKARDLSVTRQFTIDRSPASGH